MAVVVPIDVVRVFVVRDFLVHVGIVLDALHLGTERIVLVETDLPAVLSLAVDVGYNCNVLVGPS